MNQFTILIFAIISTSSFAQISPPNLNFIDVTEKWKFVYEDPNYINSPTAPSSTPYSQRIPMRFKIKNNSLFLLETTTTPSPYVGPMGSVLYNIDLTTGLPIWIDNNTQFTGSEYRYFINNSDIFIDDNTVSIAGYRDLEPLEYTLPRFAFYGAPIHRTVDVNTGLLIEQKHGNNTPSGLSYSVTGPGTKVIKNTDGKYSTIGVDLAYNEGVIHNSYKFYELDEEMDYTNDVTDSIVYNSGLQSTLPQLSYFPSFRIYDDQTMLCLFGTKNPADFQYSPEKLFLNWYDISDKNNVLETRSLDVIDDVYFPRDLEFPVNVELKDDQIVLSQRVFFSQNSPEPSNEFVWLSWYDIEGNKIGYLDPIHIDNRYYYSTIVLGNKDGSLYIGAAFRENATEGYDILKIEPGDNNYDRVGTISIPNNISLDFSIPHAQILPDGDLFAAVGMAQQGNGTFYNFHYYYRFDGSTLGILTNTNEQSLTDENLKLYPNPAKDLVNINLNENRSGNIRFINHIGSLVAEYRIDNLDEYQINTSNLNGGMYNVIFTSDNSNYQQQQKLIVVK